MKRETVLFIPHPVFHICQEHKHFKITLAPPPHSRLFWKQTPQQFPPLFKKKLIVQVHICDNYFEFLHHCLWDGQYRYLSLVYCIFCCWCSYSCLNNPNCDNQRYLWRPLVLYLMLFCAFRIEISFFLFVCVCLCVCVRVCAGWRPVCVFQWIFFFWVSDN